MAEAQCRSNDRRLRLAILVNTVAPYRMPTFEGLAQLFRTVVFHGGSEPNREWDSSRETGVELRKVWTFQVRMRKRTGVAGVRDTSYVHFNAGLLWELPRFRPDIIISNELGLRTCIALSYAYLANIPHWVWWGGTLHSERNIGGIRKVLRGALARSIKRWISYGTTSTEYLVTLGVHRDEILQIQNCVPQEIFTSAPLPTRDWFAGEPAPLLLSPGQLIARKGHDKLIEACGRQVARGRQLTLVLVGKGPERERLVDLARANGLEHFHILPNQSQPSLNELYRRADAMVFPTLEDVWGLVVNEALWAGCPVLCSHYAGCAPEIVPEANVFDPVSPDSFDAALEKVFDGSVVSASSSIGAMLTHEEVTGTIIRSLLTDTLEKAEHKGVPHFTVEDEARSPEY